MTLSSKLTHQKVKLMPKSTLIDSYALDVFHPILVNLHFARYLPRIWEAMLLGKSIMVFANSPDTCA